MTRWNLVFSSKSRKISPPKSVQPLLEAKITKIIQVIINMDPCLDCFLCEYQNWTWYDHWESLKLGSAPLYRLYCIYFDIIIIIITYNHYYLILYWPKKSSILPSFVRFRMKISYGGIFLPKKWMEKISLEIWFCGKPTICFKPVGKTVSNIQIKKIIFRETRREFAFSFIFGQPLPQNSSFFFLTWRKNLFRGNIGISTIW